MPIYEMIPIGVNNVEAINLNDAKEKIKEMICKQLDYAPEKSIREIQ